MYVAARASEKMGHCSYENIKELKNLLTRFHLPIALPAFSMADYSTAIKRDKKNREGVLRMVLNKGIGGYLITEVKEPETFFKSFWDEIS
jgi:3-dehydroquinate synthase